MTEGPARFGSAVSGRGARATAWMTWCVFEVHDELRVDPARDRRVADGADAIGGRAVALFDLRHAHAARRDDGIAGPAGRPSFREFRRLHRDRRASEAIRVRAVNARLRMLNDPPHEAARTITSLRLRLVPAV